jgi:hypothetical protein
MTSRDDIGNEVAEKDACFHNDNPRQFNVSGSHIRPDGILGGRGGEGSVQGHNSMSEGEA